MESEEPDKKMLGKRPKAAVNYGDLEKFLYCGPYQLIVAVIYQIVSFVFAFNLIFMPFMILEPPWRCDPHANISTEVLNSSSSDRCSLLRSGQCPNITWYNVSFHSIVSEWDLVCDRKHVVYDVLTVQMAAMLVGTPLVGRLADRLGRKPTLLLCTLSQAALGIATGFANSWQTFVACRFFAVLSGAGLMSVAGVYVVESVSKRNRLFIMAIGGVNIGMAFSALLALGLQEWRALVITASSFSLVTAVLTLGTTEPPRWLIQHGKEEQARKSYRYILGVNRKQVEQFSNEQWNELLEYARKRSSRKPPSFWDLFRRRELFIRTIVLSFAMFVMKLVSTFLMLSMDDLAGSIYLNAVIYGLVNWSGGFVCSLIDRSFRQVGRKHMVGTLFCVVIVCSLCMTVLKWLKLDYPSIDRTLVFVGAAVSSPLWISFTLIIMESFPTLLRSTASGTSTVIVNLAGLIVPQLLMWVTVWKPIPWIVVTVTAVGAQLSFLLKVPETKGKPLTEEFREQDKASALCDKEEQR